MFQSALSTVLSYSSALTGTSPILGEELIIRYSRYFGQSPDEKSIIVNRHSIAVDDGSGQG